MFPTEPALLFPWASLVVDSEPMTLLHHDEGLYQPNTSFASLRHPATPCCRHPATPCDTLRQSLRQSLSGENRKFRSGKVESSDFRGRARAKPAIPSSLSRVSPIAAGSRHGRARVARRRAALGNGLCKGRYGSISVAIPGCFSARPCSRPSVERTGTPRAGQGALTGSQALPPRPAATGSRGARRSEEH